MSIGGDEYDEQGRTGGADMSTRSAPSRGTRIRLPGEDGDVYGVGRKPAGRPGRSLLMVVSVVVLLIAAIAFANRSGSSGSEGEDGDPGGGGPAAQPTAPSGQKPVQTEDGATGIPSGFPQTQQGAQSAAANYAVALGGDQMFKQDSRHAIVDAVYTPQAAADLKGPQDKAYSEEFLQRLGLNAQGEAPQGQAFVSRTVPVGTDLVTYDSSKATVAVWYMGLIGMTGPDSKDPVRTTWKTWTFELQWTSGDWKIAEDQQEDGPAPVPGDSRAATSEEISNAVEQYGGFSYAR